MNTIGKITGKIDTKVLLSTLWIVVMINMAYADILGLFIPGALEEVAKTSVSTGTTIPQLMLGGAIMLEIPIAMILLSRVLKFKVNRWAKHHRKCNYYCVCCRWWITISSLHIHRNYRSCVYVTHCLVFMEVAQP